MEVCHHIIITRVNRMGTETPNTGHHLAIVPFLTLIYLSHRPVGTEGSWLSKGAEIPSLHKKAPLSLKQDFICLFDFLFGHKLRGWTLCLNARSNPSVLCLAELVIKDTWLRWRAKICAEESSCFQQAAPNVGNTKLGLVEPSLKLVL